MIPLHTGNSKCQVATSYIYLAQGLRSAKEGTRLGPSMKIWEMIETEANQWPSQLRAFDRQKGKKRRHEEEKEKQEM